MARNRRCFENNCSQNQWRSPGHFHLRACDHRGGRPQRDECSQDSQAQQYVRGAAGLVLANEQQAQKRGRPTEDANAFRLDGAGPGEKFFEETFTELVERIQQFVGDIAFDEARSHLPHQFCGFGFVKGHGLA